MDQQTRNAFLARINAARTADVAKDIDIDLMKARHDYFGREICTALDIQYRDDVPLVDIISELYPDENLLWYNIPNITPDNYLIDHGFLYIIDYKVTVSRELVRQTYEKYTKALESIAEELFFGFDIVILQMNPITKELYISSDRFRAMFPNIAIDVDFQDFADLKRILYERFEDDEEFLQKVSHGDFTMTAPWCHEPTPELYEHPVYIEFYESLPEKYRELFDESLNHSAYSSERWNSLLYKVKDSTKEEYDAFVKSSSQSIFLCDGTYPKPSRNDILEGWELMSRRVEDMRNIQDSTAAQKPSIHFLWSQPDLNRSNDNTKKLLILARSLQEASGTHPLLKSLHALGKSMDFSEDVDKYEAHCAMLKAEARSKSRPIDYKKIEPKKIGKASVRWEQQFMITSEHFDPEDRKKLLKEFAGIGNHKPFKHKTLEDVDFDKPKILDFNLDSIYLAALSMMNKFRSELGQKSKVVRNPGLYDFYKKKIESANPQTTATIEKIFSSKYWDYINDYSTLMKNMLSMSQYNKANTFRVAACANNSVFAVLLPASDIKTKRATIVYFIITLHKSEVDVLNSGTLLATFKTSDGYISISKAMRLDKERCQRIVSSPGLFLMTTLLMYNNNPELDLVEVMNYSLFTSCSITKAMLSLTEPARYMMMNSLALSSNVKDYITEKFQPYTKTLFSVWMTRRIKKACLEAYQQRSKITVKDIHLTDFEMTQKGVKQERELTSIWFTGKVNIKEYINEIYLPFYFNAKGLHEKHHVMIDLVKTVGEIEIEQREIIVDIWSNRPRKQTVNLPIFVHSLSRMLIQDCSRHNHLRDKIESRNNFRRSPTTVSTFTSSKSCVKVGDFRDFKSKQAAKRAKSLNTAEKQYKLAHPAFFDEEKIDAEIKHSDYQMLRQAIPDFVDYITTKNFDRLYEKIKLNEVNDNRNLIELSMKYMKEHTKMFFAMFNKGQKTYKDREIFEPEWETKMCMYPIERISKERSKLNPEEMISEPGDNKLKILEQRSEQELRYLINQLRELNKTDDIEKALDGDVAYRATKIEINADMSKWSAQDVYFKYFWLVALDPILYPAEKQRMVYFMCNYMQKHLIIPDDVMCAILDQKSERPDDIFNVLTNQFHSNHFEVKRNWLQGNFNYISSYVHSVAMAVFKDIIKSSVSKLEGQCLINSLVHSDDNQTSITIIQNKLDDDPLVQHCREVFELVCLSFGCQANMKKTYITNFVKEFVSLFNLSGEPFSIYGRFLLTAVGDCSYTGPYEDLANRISATQTAIKHGCPPSYAWVSVYLNHWMTYQTYNMLPGQSNDPCPALGIPDRMEIAPELCGCLNSELSTLALVGLEADNLEFLVKLLKKYSPIMLKKEPVLNQVDNIHTWDLSLLTEGEKFRLKLMRYLNIDSEADSTDPMGETSEMRTRSLITPRKFTTAGSLSRLVSYMDYQATMSSEVLTDNLMNFVIHRPELLVTKGENCEEYVNMTVFRYYSKKFKESLSVQNPAQLFIEQMLFSNKPTIDYNFIRERFLNVNDSNAAEEFGVISGRLTIKQTLSAIRRDLDELDLTLDDIHLTFQYMVCNDPLMLTVANSLVMSTVGCPQERLAPSACNMPEFRNLKLIHHSPALVLRALTKDSPDIPGANFEELRRDLEHLKTFIEQTDLEGKMLRRVLEHEDKVGKEDKLFRIKEFTKFYQICYEYIRSTEHRIKIFILPVKCRTSYDFCAVIQGNTINDDRWYTVHYLKQIHSGGYKGVMQKTTPGDVLVAQECFRVLTFFTDSFIAEHQRLEFISQVINEFTYKQQEVSRLLNVLKHSNNRQEFLPLLLFLGLLEQRDLDLYDAMKSSERISWNYRQVSREFNTGPIDLTINGYNRDIRIIGEDNKLKVAELRMIRLSYENIINSGRKLLGCRHGLRFERFEPVDIEPNNYYITYQRKSQHAYSYQVHSYTSIMNRNSEPSRGRLRNDLIPVCPVLISQLEDYSRVQLQQCIYLNADNYYSSRMKITDTETVSIKRTILEKMRLFEGPDVTYGMININKLMKTTELLSLDYNKLANTSIISFSKLLQCTQSTDINPEEDIFVMSDEPLEQSIPEYMNISPAFNVYISKTGERNMTYKNAFKTLVARETNKFKRSFDFTGDGFVSPSNLGVISVIKFLIEHLETNEWSSILYNTIHLTMIIEGMDREFHILDLPKLFIIDPVEPRYDWGKLKSYINSIPCPNDPLWKELFDNFKRKSKQLIERLIAPETDFELLTKQIAAPFGRTMFEFE
ncbi:L [Okola virus]|uniref:RNA-directed RNA polymerase L n=1 Tax=Okola virus TaxID=2748254 RepID=A0A7D9MVW5_9VIRU|nr:L [Okola virus] [Okola virus]QLA47051.1 L [Okola virus] [Okola virus]